MMNCPFCAEEIKEAANVCRYCGRDLVTVRPLLEVNLALTKRVDAIEQQLAELADAQDVLHRHVGLWFDGVPSIHRGSAIALLLLWIFVAGLFIAEVNYHGSGLALIYAASALTIAPMIFGFLCQNTQTHPSGSDLAASILVTLVAVIEIQVIRWELIGGLLIPSGWGIEHAAGELPPDTWETLLLNAATIFLGFSAGVFFRYLLASRHRAQITVATPVSKFIVARMGGELSPAQIEDKIKRTDALIHSLVGIATAGGAVVTAVWSHFPSTPH